MTPPPDFNGHDEVNLLSKNKSGGGVKRYSLEIIVFIAGAAVMILELVGSRLVAPYLGTSLFVWTSLIGVILGCLSLGYWLGGKVSDRRPDYGAFSAVLFTSAVLTAAIALIGDPVLVIVQDKILDVRVGAVVATAVLFGLPAVLLGMVSPYAARLKLTDVGHSGSTVGALYALSTLGSIAGTFLCGFVLIARFCVPSILLVVAGMLAVLSIVAFGHRWVIAKAVVALLFMSGAFVAESYANAPHTNGFVDVNTPYNRVWIFDGYSTKDNARVRVMQINDENSSAMFLDQDGLVHDYTKYYRLARHFRPGFKRALMIGGAAYSYPKDFLKEYTDATLDVIEIDPKLTELAKKYFGLKSDPRLRIFHEDARTYLNRTSEKYDVIYGDAFRSFSVPYHLTTREAARRMYDALNDDGVVLVNLISAVEGEKGKLLRAMLATFKSVFPRVLIYAVDDADDGSRPQNIMLVALKSDKRPKPFSADPELNAYLFKTWIPPVPQDLPVLTDAYAPVEDYTLPVIVNVRKDRMNPMRERLERFFGKTHVVAIPDKKA